MENSVLAEETMFLILILLLSSHWPSGLRKQYDID